MILRDYQKDAIQKTKTALKGHNNTLIVAPTGAGKTIILSALIDELIGEREETEGLFGSGKTVVLQHRLELVKQNSEKFLRVAPHFLDKTSILTGKEKNADGEIVFATVQTLSTKNGMSVIPRLNYLIIDEAHHVAAGTYKDIITHYTIIDPSLKVIGLTATASRADGKGLGDTFDNVAYKIDTDLLIQMGHLVPPDSYIVSLGIDHEIDEISKKKITEKAKNELLADVYKPVHYRIEEEWAKRAPDKHTICFCTTIEEAKDMTLLFLAKGHRADVVHSKMSGKDVRATIDRFHTGEIQVLFNVSILTEGFDCPTVNCVMLTRSCSAKSTMIQMIGRGLRPIVEEKDRWMEKHDCLVLDFGDSLKTHGTLRSDINIKKIKESSKEGVVQLLCPNCKKVIFVEIGESYCPKCGAEIIDAIMAAALQDSDESGEGVGKVPLEDFKMVPIDLTQNSPFNWLDMGIFFSGSKNVMVASGFKHMVVMKEIAKDIWIAIGVPQRGKSVNLGTGREAIAFAHCNNYMSMHENDAASRKSAYWHSKPPSAKQYELLESLMWSDSRDGSPSNCYEASCMISYIKGFTKFKATAVAAYEERSKSNDEREVGVS